MEVKEDSPSKNNQQEPRLADVDVVMSVCETVLGPMVVQRQKEHKFQRAKFFMFLAFFAVVLLINFFGENLHKRFVLKNDYVSVVRVTGEIMPGKPASSEVIIPLLEKAFSDKTAKGVIIHINSPGGTPVAAGEIHDRIISLQEEYPDKEVIAVSADYLTSGAYMVATGADTIYANQASLVGSIGVIIRSFGFAEIAEKVGVERRVVHAGDNKNRFDQFLPLEEKDKVMIEKQLSIVHDQFIDMVKDSRGDRLKVDKYPNLFTGEMWTGSEAVEMGLVDGNMTLADAAKKHFGTKRLRVFAPSKPLFGNMIPSFAKALTSEINDSLGSKTPMMMLTPF